MKNNIRAFEIEYKRQELARKHDLQSLGKLYDRGLPEIIDINKPKFWDELFSDEGLASMSYGMVRDRINTAVNYMPRGKLKILDIGAGMGYAEELLSKDKGRTLYANDFSDVSVKNLKKKFEGVFEKQSIYNLKYPDNFFDAVLVLEVLEHIPPSKIFGVLGSIKKLLKDEGFLIVSVPMNEGLDRMPDNPNGHLRMYTNELINAELELAGFKTTNYKNLFAFDNMYMIKTLIAKLFRTHKPNNIVLRAKKI